MDDEEEDKDKERDDLIEQLARRKGEERWPDSIWPGDRTTLSNPKVLDLKEISHLKANAEFDLVQEKVIKPRPRGTKS